MAGCNAGQTRTMQREAGGAAGMCAHLHLPAQVGRGARHSGGCRGLRQGGARRQGPLRSHRVCHDRNDRGAGLSGRSAAARQEGRCLGSHRSGGAGAKSAGRSQLAAHGLVCRRHALELSNQLLVLGQQCGTFGGLGLPGGQKEQ